MSSIFQKPILRTTQQDKFLVLSRTRMKDDRVCVGGCLLSSNRYVRILNKDERNIASSEPYQICQIYDIDFYDRINIILPHIEDIIVIKRSFFRVMEYTEFMYKVNSLDLKLHCIKNLFEGALNWQEYKGFLLKSKHVKGSVLISSLDYPLYKFENNPRHFSVKLEGEWYRIPYVGEKQLEDRVKIPDRTPIRFSLARWWTGHGHINPFGVAEERAYLQISGFYI